MIREAQPEDRRALVELERLCPEMGAATIQIEALGNIAGPITRFPGSRGYVALAEDGSTIIGTVFSSVAPTQLNGKLLLAAYLFSLRVHPAYRRRGVASALVSHACERAADEAGVRAAWAAIIEGNEASLRTFDRVGFVRLRDLRARIVFMGLAWPYRLPRLHTRLASSSDLPSVADALNRFYASYNFWRPKTPDQLETELEGLGHSPGDIEVALAKDGTVLAAASALEVPRIARLRLLGLRALPDLANRLLRPLFGLLPINTLLVRQYAFPAAEPAIGVALIRALHRRYLPRTWAATVAADPLDPIWEGLDRLWGITGRVHLVVKSDEPVDQSRPSYPL